MVVVFCKNPRCRLKLFTLEAFFEEIGAERTGRRKAELRREHVLTEECCIESYTEALAALEVYCADSGVTLLKD